MLLSKVNVKNITMFLSALFFSIGLMASPISDAVDAGKVKELPSGYVEAVDKSAEIVALVKEVNEGRKEAYEKIAKSNGLSVEQVGKASYQKRFGK